jgi:hypothetical protein
MRQRGTGADSQSRAEQRSGRGGSLLALAGNAARRENCFAGVRAVWMASQAQIKFYADDGAVLRVVDLAEPRQAKAA